MVGLGAVAAMVFVVALMWSDRAPGILAPILSEGLQQLWEGIDPGDLGAAAVSRDDLPRTDFLLHVSVWAAVSTLVFVALWTWRSLVLGSITLVGVSVLVELGQGRYSSNRQVELTDAVANAIGIAIGATVALVLFAMWETVAGLLAVMFKPAEPGRRR